MSALRACAQDHVVDTLTDTCTIQRRGKTSDGKGGFTITYTTLASGVACYVAPASSFSRGEQVVAGKITSLYDVLVSFAATQDVISTDRIIWNTRTFEVIQPRPRTAMVLLQVEAKELK